MSNRLIEWAKAESAHMEQSIELMKSGKMIMTDRSGAEPKDVTQDTIQDRQKRLQKLRDIIAASEKSEG